MELFGKFLSPNISMKRGVKLLMEYIQLTVELGSLSPLFTTCFMHSKGGLIHWISELSTERSDEFCKRLPGLRGAGGTFFMLDQLQPDQDRP